MIRFHVVLLACLCILRTHPACAQYYYYNDKYYNGEWLVELGGSAGIMNSLTDIGGKKGIGKKFIKDLNWKMTKPSFGLYVVATYKDVLGVRLEATFGSVQSYDSILKKVATSTFGRYERNLSFRSTIRDFQLVAELHPLFFKIYDEGKVPRWSPYVSAGIGYFVFNPQAQLNNEWYYLHPLRTEGQGFAEYPNRKTYSLTQVNIPLGLGVKYEVSPWISARLEFAYRILFTDYLDDASNEDYVDPALFSTYLTPHNAAIAQQLADRRISTVINKQRGDPKDNDAFFTIQFKIGFTFRSMRRKQQ
ncbi:MAG TPA: DUF6089 family protein [Chitinophagaceae bacterium]|nr:DUF6089 family protein [Chitinophagaceae bacterium]